MRLAAFRKRLTDIQLRGMSPHTVKEYRDRVRVFLKYFENKPFETLGETDFRIFLEYLDREKDIAPATINNYNSALRFFFEVTLEQTLCYRRIPRKKDPIKLPTAFTRQEILWFLDAIDDSSRYKAIFSLTYACGLRLSEVRHLRIKDIDKQQMRLFVYQGKGQRDRWIPLSTFAFEDLCTYFKEYKPSHPEGYLFLNGKDGLGNDPISERAIQDAFKRYHKRGRIPTEGSPHPLRHYSASVMHAIGIPDQYIMQRGGWSSDSVLKQIYRGTMNDYSRKYTDKTNEYFKDMQHEMQHNNKKPR